MAKNNEDQPYCFTAKLGTQSADVVLPVGYIPRKSKLLGISLVNGATVAASNDDYIQVSVKNDTTVIAELDTRVAHENGLTANTAKSLNLASNELAAGTTLTAEFAETHKAGAAVTATVTETVKGVVDPETVEQQTIEFDETPEQGQWKLSYDGTKTGFLAYNANAGAIQAALRLITGIETVTVAGSYGAGFTVTFTGVSGDAELLAVTDSTLALADNAVKPLTNALLCFELFPF